MNDKIHWPDVAVVVACLFAYSVVAVFDDWKLEEANRRADAYQQAMLACLNSGGFFFKDTQRAYICSAKEI